MSAAEILAKRELKRVFVAYARYNGFTQKDIELDFEPMLKDVPGWLEYLKARLNEYGVRIANGTALSP